MAPAPVLEPEVPRAAAESLLHHALRRSAAPARKEAGILSDGQSPQSESSLLDTYLSYGVQPQGAGDYTTDPLLRELTQDLQALETLDETSINLFDLGYQECPNLDDRGQRCQSKECVQCSIIEFCQIAACISASAPTHHLGISRVDEGSMKEFVRTVRQTDDTFAYAWAVEINPRQTWCTAMATTTLLPA